MGDFDPAAFNSTRRRYKRWGWTVFLGGLVFTLLDLTTPFPTPARGQFVLAFWAPVMLIGGFLLVLGYRLPLREALLLADRYGGALDVATVVRELNLSADTAERVLKTACRKMGHGTWDDEVTGIRFYVFHPPLDREAPARADGPGE
jgi:hypothetical protein